MSAGVVERHPGAADAAGVVVLGALAAWSLVTAALLDGRPEGSLLAVLAVAAGYAGGRVAGALLPVAAPAVGALAGVALVVAPPQAVRLLDGPARPGGAAGTAGMLALSAGAACCAARAAGWPPARAALWLLAAGVAVTAALLGSTAGVVAALVVTVCATAAGRVGRVPGLVGLAVASVLVAAGTWAVAAGAPRGWAGSAVAEALGVHGTHRVLLWHAALAVTGDHVVLGAGPGRFAELGPAVAGQPAGDAGLHSGLLQQAAEQGLVGVVLLAAGYCWVLHALWHSPCPTPVVLTAGAALTVLAALAITGSALSCTTVTTGAGLLSGVATAHPFGDEAVDTGD